MLKLLLLVVIMLGATGLAMARRGARVPAVGQPAPAFSLPDANGQLHSLGDYRGRYVVLYFYPKDETPTCTREACSFRDNFARLAAMDVAVLGVSVQSPQSHAAFAAHHHLPFTLLSDEEGKVSAAYGSLYDFGFARWSKRHTFLINPQGRIANVWLKVDADHQVDQVADALTRLRQH